MSRKSKQVKYTKEFLEPLVKQSLSMRDLLDFLGLQYSGGNYHHLYKIIKELNLDKSHFLGQGHNKGKVFGPKRPLEEYLNGNFHISSNSLRIRLLKEGYFEKKCQLCNNTHWLEEEIPLELHHIDQNHENNQLTNLQILCSNCHSSVHKKLSRNNYIKRKKVSNKTVIQIIPKETKEQILERESKRKQQLKPNQRKVERPPYEQLLQELKKSNYCAVARKYGVTDNCIRKWIKMYEKYNSK